LIRSIILVHWSELTLNMGDLVAAVLLSPEVLGARRGAVEKWFRVNVRTYAKLASIFVLMISFVFIALSLHMASDLHNMVSQKRFDLLRGYSTALLVTTIIYGLVVLASFFDQYLGWADRCRLGNKTAAQVFFYPGLILFFVIRAVSIVSAFEGE